MLPKVMAFISAILWVVSIALNTGGQDATFVMLCAIYCGIVALWNRAALGEEK